MTNADTRVWGKTGEFPQGGAKAGNRVLRQIVSISPTWGFGKRDECDQDGFRE